MTDRRQVRATPTQPTVSVKRRPIRTASDDVVLRGGKRTVISHGAPPVVTKPITRRVVPKAAPVQKKTKR